MKNHASKPSPPPSTYEIKSQCLKTAFKAILRAMAGISDPQKTLCLKDWSPAYGAMGKWWELQEVGSRGRSGDLEVSSRRTTDSSPLFHI